MHLLHEPAALPINSFGFEVVEVKGDVEGEPSLRKVNEDLRREGNELKTALQRMELTVNKIALAGHTQQDTQDTNDGNTNV